MASDTLSPARMMAFSDGVIAVIITIMVLELKVPAVDGMAGVQAILPTLGLYLLSFVLTGIYWVNHHYLLDDLEYVSHGLLWSNLIFLFCLSLIPFATLWVGTKGLTHFSAALYAVTCALPATSWQVLSRTTTHLTGQQPANGLLKQAVSTVLYLSAIPAAHLSPYLSVALIAVVAILWLTPPRRIVEQTRSRRQVPSRSQHL